MLLKKSFLLFAAALMSLSVVAEDSIPAKGVHPYKLEENENAVPELAHWSLIPHIGFSSFDGDFSSEMKHNVAIPTAGLALEYSFTPTWGLGIEYMYDMYTVTGKHNVAADTLLTGHQHKAGAYVSLDLINLWFPRARKKIFSLHAMVGGGAAFYKRGIYYDNEDVTRGHTLEYEPKSDDGYSTIAYVQAGANFEFNLNRSIALGLRANYSYFTRDYLDGRGYQGEYAHPSKNNDGIFDITLNLRYKINAVKKSHPRNMPRDYFLDNYGRGNKPAEKDTVYYFSKDTVVCKEIHEKTEIYGGESDQVFYVYFDNAKSELTERGLNTIQEVAQVLNGRDDLYIDVVGICDNTGSDDFNAKLAENRAKRVLEELKEEYNIPEDRFLTSGRGKIVGRRSKGAYGPNRRAEIRLISKEDFDRRKAEREKNGSYNVNNDNTAPVVTDRESVNANTLTRLARNYFSNPNCWVYIYEANKPLFKDGLNKMPVGLDVKIPDLTEEQKKITKEEAEAYYQSIK